MFPYISEDKCAVSVHRAHNDHWVFIILCVAFKAAALHCNLLTMKTDA